jgi:hypothetical protein
MKLFLRRRLPTLNGQWRDAGFVAHHSCGTVAASHRLPRARIQIGKQQTSFFEFYISLVTTIQMSTLKSDITGFPRMRVTLGDPLAGFSSTSKSVSKTPAAATR